LIAGWLAGLLDGWMDGWTFRRAGWWTDGHRNDVRHKLYLNEDVNDETRQNFLTLDVEQYACIQKKSLMITNM